MSHHGASHHSNKPEAIESFARINAYFVMMYSYLLEQLRSTPDGDGNLLDHSVVLIGSSMANANEHDHAPVPMLVAGGMCGQLKGGRHIRCADNTPHSNLLLSIVNKAGVQMDSFGDSTEPIAL